MVMIRGDGGARRGRRVAAATTLAMLGIAAAVIALVAVQIHGLSGGASRAAAGRPWPVPASSASIDIGVTTLPLARNSWRAWRPSDLATVDVWEQAVHKHASVVMWYADWNTTAPALAQLESVAARGAVPEVTWEPWRSFRSEAERSRRPGVPARVQPRYRLRNIVAGTFDPYIRRWAQRLAAYGKPVRLRFAQEMNGDWYPWSERRNGNRRGDFVRAWRHVHRLFRAAGAANVLWVWGPAAVDIDAGLYPGDAFVDYVGLTAFNGGLQMRYNRWRPFAKVVGEATRRLHAIAPGKPIELSEVGCAEEGGDKAAWITGMFATLPRHPDITSVIWYDVDKGSDWRVSSSRRAADAFSAGVAGSRFR
jgi:hypothetical protein